MRVSRSNNIVNNKVEQRRRSTLSHQQCLHLFQCDNQNKDVSVTVIEKDTDTAHLCKVKRP